MEVTIERRTELPLDLLANLLTESEQEGWRLVRRLTDERRAQHRRLHG